MGDFHYIDPGIQKRKEMKMPRKRVAEELSFWDERLVKKLAKKVVTVELCGCQFGTDPLTPSPEAEAIIRKAFPGYRLTKIRKDAGTSHKTDQTKEFCQHERIVHGMCLDCKMQFPNPEIESGYTKL